MDNAPSPSTSSPPIISESANSQSYKPSMTMLAPSLDLPRLLPSALSPSSPIPHLRPNHHHREPTAAPQHGPSPRSSFSSAASRTSCTSESSSTTASLSFSPEVKLARAVAQTLREARPRRMTLGEGSAGLPSHAADAMRQESVPPVPARGAEHTTGTGTRYDVPKSAARLGVDRLQVPIPSTSSQYRRRDGHKSHNDLPDFPPTASASTLICPLPPVPAKHPLLPRPIDALECLRDLWREIELLDSDAREELGRQRATLTGIQVVVGGIKRRAKQNIPA